MDIFKASGAPIQDKKVFFGAPQGLLLHVHELVRDTRLLPSVMNRHDPYNGKSRKCYKYEVVTKRDDINDWDKIKYVVKDADTKQRHHLDEVHRLVVV